ncbi:GAF domain-containing SpoIIE family protein phosphatase [Amycolatopsis sp. NPDC051114]|uniref:PP2C family protein-serine/threonine phosphatase n=1 Tax=Amycolatopsis sp. NPDC051114 TaxID=3155280 RepID=UPI003416AF68
MTEPGFDGLLGAVRRAFDDGSGTPPATQVRLLTPGEARSVLGDHVAVAVTDRTLLADLVLGRAITGAIAVAGDEQAALVYTTEVGGRPPSAVAAAIDAATAHLADTVRRLRSEAGVLDALHSTGRELTAQLDIGRIVQDATDAATKATGAEFGAFFYNLIDELGESYTLYTISGVPRAAFERFPMPRNTEVFAPTFDGAGTVRSPDITRDRRFGKNAPHHGMPEGHLPVCSYLAVSAISPTSGEVLGGFFFGHSEPGRFTARHEFLAEGIAAYSAIALDNARLYERERTLASELSRSMLPVAPAVEGLDVLTRYLPAATGSKVGGDWFDVIALPSGATAFVIGDVVGHGVTAATVMGQVRTAIRCYALLELAPSEVLRNVSALTGGLFGESFVTCFYAVHRPDEGTLTFANAGHLPAILVRPDGAPEEIGEALAQPLGIGAEFPQRTTGFPPGADLVLYTDGLVESRTRDLTLGVESLLAGIPVLLAATDLETAWDKLVDELTHGRHDDDIALIHVRHRGEDGA